MLYRFLVTLILIAVFPFSLANEIQPGKSLGAKNSEAPHWFKESFLEFEDDVAEASDAGKRVMLYFHQQGCPYCARLVEENFNDPAIETYVKKHFDGITINMWGDREVVNVSGQLFTEKTFASALKVQYTPTLVFLDEDGGIALRLNGYYPPAHFQAALKYVAEQQDKKSNFATYLSTIQQLSSQSLIPEDFYEKTSRLDQMIGKEGKPLAVYFETGDCEECKVMHERILTDRATRKLIITMNNVQLNTSSDQVITTPGGEKTTMKKWAQDLNIGYHPSVIFFDTSGNEVMRIDGFMKTFHFQSVYQYVLTQAYLTQPSFQRFISDRAEKIREAGFDTNIWGYQSSYE